MSHQMCSRHMCCWLVSEHSGSAIMRMAPVLKRRLQIIAQLTIDRQGLGVFRRTSHFARLMPLQQWCRWRPLSIVLQACDSAFHLWDKYEIVMISHWDCKILWAVSHSGHPEVPSSTSASYTMCDRPSPAMILSSSSAAPDTCAITAALSARCRIPGHGKMRQCNLSILQAKVASASRMAAHSEQSF